MKITVQDIADYLQHKEDVRTLVNEHLSSLDSNTSYQVATTEALLIKLREIDKIDPKIANKYKYLDNCLKENLVGLIIALLLNTMILIYITVQLANNGRNEFKYIFIGIIPLMLVISVLSANDLYNAVKTKHITKIIKKIKR